MDAIVEGLLKEMTSGEKLTLISREVGADDKSVKSALEMGLPLLLGAMNRNANQPEGISAIMKVLAQMGRNDPREGASSRLSGPDPAEGSRMLDSILGSNLEPIKQSISKKTGLPPAAVGKILSIVLPLVLAKLGGSSGQDMRAEEISKILKEESKAAISSSPEAARLMEEAFSSEEGRGGLMRIIKKADGTLKVIIFCLDSSRPLRESNRLSIPEA